MPTGIGTAIVMGGLSTASAALGFTTVIGGSLMTHFLVTTALGAAINALTPKPSLGQAASSGYNVTQTSSVADHQIVYGKTKVAGVRVFDGTTGEENKYLHRVIAFTGHEIESFEEIYLNDEVVTLDGNGNVTSPSRYDGFVRINTHLGADDQLADSDLVSEVTEWTTDHRLQGISYIYVRYKYDQDAFPNGVPELSVVIKGKKVYDPRTDTTAWSDNPALCIRDYLTNTRYGLKEDAANLDDDLFITAANVCDYYDYPTLTGAQRYTANGSFTTAASPYDFLNNILSSMGGLLWYAQGKWRVKPAYYTAPVALFTEDDLRSSISISTRHSRRDNFNTVNGVWKSAATNWQTTDFPPVTNQDFIDADNGETVNVDLNLPFSTDMDMARRIANIYLERNRQQLTVQASFGMRAFAVQVGDIIQLSNTRFGWTQKEFEVVSWTFGLTGDNDLQVMMTLREITSTVFNDYSDGAVYERDNTNLLSPFDVPLPSLDAAVVTTTINNDGTTVPQIKFSWSVTDSTVVDYYDFQWKLSTDSTWNTTDLDGTEFVLSPALSGRSYDYRVRAVNHLAVRSAFASSASPASTGDDGTTPKAPSSLVAAAGLESIKLTWTAPTQNTDNSALKDLFQYKVYRNTTNNFGTASLVGRVAADVFTDGSLVGDQIYYYWVTALDYTGNESAQSTVASATATAVIQERSNGVFYIGVTTLPTTSSGAHTDFTNAIGDPVDRDQAWFYTGTLANPTAQSVWIYEEGSGATPADSWNYQENVMVGDLLVDGTVTGGKLASNTVQTDNLASYSVTSIKVADALESDNYVSGTSGWQISRDTGNAEFNDVTVRGDIINLSQNHFSGLAGSWNIFNPIGTAQNITPLLDGSGYYSFVLVGAGGGGSGINNLGGGDYARASGGGGGGCSIFVLDWNGSDSLTVTIGSGGLADSASPSSGNVTTSSSGASSYFYINSTLAVTSAGGGGGSRGFNTGLVSGGNGGSTTDHYGLFYSFTGLTGGTGGSSNAAPSYGGGGGVNWLNKGANGGNVTSTSQVGAGGGPFGSASVTNSAQYAGGYQSLLGGFFGNLPPYTITAAGSNTPSAGGFLCGGYANSAQIYNFGGGGAAGQQGGQGILLWSKL